MFKPESKEERGENRHLQQRTYSYKEETAVKWPDANILRKRIGNFFMIGEAENEEI